MRFRFLLNVVVIALFGAGVFGVTSAINLIASNDELEEHEFSFVKRTADQHWGDKNYEAAAHYYKQLVEADSLNGSGHAAYSHSMKMQIEALLRRTIRAKRENDQSAIDEYRKKLAGLVEEAIATYKNTMDFPQFRNYARIHLAVLEGYSGNKELAAKYVTLFVDDNGNLNDHKPLFQLYGCLDVLDEF